jgi:polycomb protein EED
MSTVTVQCPCRQPLYDTQCSPWDNHLCAVVGGNHLYLLDLCAAKCVQAYWVGENEVLYTVAWLGPDLLALAGSSCVIRLLSVSSGDVLFTLQGHTGDVYEVRVHPHNPDILVSASKDKSARVWSVGHKACLAILAGDKGHQEEVLSADFDLQGRVITSGMDHHVMVWQLDSQLTAFIDRATPSPPDHTLALQFPLYATNKVHGNYVDYVRAYGPFILSKSVEERIVLWRPVWGDSGQFSEVSRFEYAEGDAWFVRFDVSSCWGVLGVGNLVGEVFVWDMDSGKLKAKLNTKSASIIRKVAFSSEGTRLVTVSDDAQVHIFSLPYSFFFFFLVPSDVVPSSLRFFLAPFFFLSSARALASSTLESRVRDCPCLMARS